MTVLIEVKSAFSKGK